MKRGSLLTAPEVARHCNADLKTIHNWVNAGKIRSFRTPGRHLRFRVEDVIDFLERFGYPIPLELSSQARPKIMMISEDIDTMVALEQHLTGKARLKPFNCPVQAMLAIGRENPMLVVIDADHPNVELREVVSKLVKVEMEHLPRIVVYLTEGIDQKQFKGIGASLLVNKPDIKELSDSIAEILAREKIHRVTYDAG